VSRCQDRIRRVDRSGVEVGIDEAQAASGFDDAHHFADSREPVGQVEEHSLTPPWSRRTRWETVGRRLHRPEQIQKEEGVAILTAAKGLVEFLIR
jgi:hypothetical protein